ncbi:MAG: hypothetical protein FWE38_00720 [Firmicutes bacterium]|nr:hypothetical protein [Bacillota bacterium]
MPQQRKREDPDVHKQIHNGRREKLRASFLKYGLESFNPVQVLEYALGLAIPRIDTNPIAHALINRFGSLSGVLEAHPDRLQEIDGIGEVSAIFISFLRQFAKYAAALENHQHKIKSPAEAIEHLQSIMGMALEEELVILCMDRNGTLLLQEQIRGNQSRVEVHLRNIVDAIMRVKSAYVILAHNHIDESVNPSDADIHFTRTLLGILRPLEIMVMDHLIFGKDGKVFSFAGKGLLGVLEREHRAFINCKDYEEMING